MITIYVDDPGRIDLHVHSTDGQIPHVALWSLGSSPGLDQPPRAEKSISAPRRVVLVSTAAMVVVAGIAVYVAASPGHAGATLPGANAPAFASLPAPRPPPDPLLSVQREVALQRALASRPTVTPPPADPVAPAAPSAPGASVAAPPANPFGLHR